MNMVQKCSLVLFSALLPQVTLTTTWPQEKATLPNVRTATIETVYLGYIDYQNLNAKLDRRGLRQLAFIATELKEQKDIRLRVIGYAPRGRSDLAQARVEEVIRELAKQGLPVKKTIISIITSSHKKNKNLVEILAEKQPLPPTAKPVYFVWLVTLIGIICLVWLGILIMPPLRFNR